MTTLEQDAKRKAVGNERAKLTATFLNGVAVGVFIVGCVGPVLAYVLQPQASAPPLSVIVGAGLTCVIVAEAIHFVARAFLGELRP